MNKVDDRLQQKLAEDFWLHTLENAGKPWPTYATNANRPQNNSSAVNIDCPAPLAQMLEQASQGKSVAAFRLLLGSFSYLISQYLQASEVLINTPLFKLKEIDKSLKHPFFLKVPVQANSTVSQYQTTVEKLLNQAYKHHHYSFEKLQARLPQAGTGQNLLYQTGLAYNKVSQEAHALIKQCPLCWIFNQHAQGLSLQIHFNHQYFTAPQVQNMTSQYWHLLAQWLEQSAAQVKKLSLFSAQEMAQVHAFNPSPTPFDQSKLLHELFEAQVEKQPQSPAVYHGQEQLSYQQVNHYANALAHILLKKHHLQPGQRVAILLDKNQWLMPAVLGVLKAGGAYVPVDPQYPESRRHYLIQDSEAQLVLTTQDHVAKLPKNGVPHLVLEQALAKPAHVENPGLKLPLQNPAYVIYTSGSTGQPKGVLVGHKSVLNLVNWFNQTIYAQHTTPLTTLLTANISFDGAVKNLLPPLLLGGRMVLLNEAAKRDLPTYINTLEQHQVQVADMTPAFLQVLLNAVEERSTKLNLLYTLVGGEALTQTLIEKYYANSQANSQLLNVYGVTECTVDSTFEVALPHRADRLSIGKPLPNTHIYICNPDLRVQGIGVPGEICIAGEGLSLGYLNRPKLTAQRFVHNPFAKSGKLYRTGDLGRWTTNGNLEFLGRIDEQVKVRGFRIELGEVAHYLKAYEGIEEAVAGLYQSPTQEKELCVWFTGPTQVDASQLRAFMAQQVPEYMVPSTFVHIEQLPLSPNGKVDKKALPNPQTHALGNKTPYVAPENKLQETLVQVWQAVLGREKIGIKDHFFDIGGHSLNATNAIALLYKNLKVNVNLTLFFTHPTIEQQALVIEAMEQAEYVSITPAPVQDHYDLSHTQKRFWIQSMFEAESAAYNMPDSAMLTGQVNQQALEQSVALLCQHHESLRTVFITHNGHPQQKILPQIKVPLTVQDLAQLAPQEKGQHIQQSTHQFFHKAFDLEKGPLFGLHLIKIEAETWLLLLNVHHIISDGWSQGLIKNQLLTIYQSLVNNTPVPLSAPALQFKDYSHWHNNLIANGHMKAHQDYWTQKLADKPNGINLPFDYPRPAVQTFNGSRVHLNLGTTLSQKISALSNQTQATLFMVVLGAINVLLYKYSRQQDIMVGSPVAGRQHPELHPIVGCLINTLVFRTTIDPTQSFAQYLETVKQDALQSYEYQDYPFDLLIEELELERDLSQSPIFNVMLTLNNTGMSTSQPAEQATAPAEQVPGGLVEAPEEGTGMNMSKFDLSFFLLDTAPNYAISLEYNTDLFTQHTAQQMLNHLYGLLQAVTSTNAPIGQLNFLSTEEEEHLLQAFNPAPTAWPQHETTVSLFEKQAQQLPTKTAVIYQEEQLSFAQLNESANRLAHWLMQENGVKPGQVVALVCHRNMLLPQLIWGVLKAGAAYLPLDPQAPIERLALILNDAQPVLILTDDAPPALPNGYQATTWNSLQPTLAQQPSQNPITPLQPQHPAYIIYTSGSTGVPKGVVMSHLGLVCRLAGEQELYGHGQHTVTCHSLNYTFDASLFALFLAPTLGGTLVIPEHNSLYDAPYMLELWQKHGVNILCGVPLYYALMARTIEANPEKYPLKELKYVTIGGESLQNSLVTKLKAFLPHIHITNMYGPTEAALGCIIEQDVQTINQDVIGRPMPNTTALLLNEEGQLVPPGLTGEICIGGPGLAIEYLNSPELTQERFIQNPYATQLANKTPGFEARLYRSGDMGYWTPEGKIVYLGRKDQQIKVRGYRIEIGEIEQALLKHNQVNEVAVGTYKDSEGVLGLIAYITSNDTPTAPDLQAFLKQHLPDYMVPALFALMPTMPTTDSGKIDRKALPEPNKASLLAGKPFIAPGTETEKALAHIWAAVLKVQKVGLHDDFFALGGHSLKATQVTTRVAKEMGKDLTLRQMFAHPTLQAQALAIEASQQANAQALSSIEPVPTQPHYALSNSQRRLWIIDQRATTGHTYNMPLSYMFYGQLDVQALEKAFLMLIERHESLRTTFTIVNGQPRQVITPLEQLNFSLKLEDQSQHEDAAALVQSLSMQEAHKVFNLEQDAPLRVKLVKVAPEGFLLLVTMHHIVSDGWSMEVIKEEIQALYSALLEGKPNPLAPLRIQYKDFAAWQNQQLQEGHLGNMKSWWLEQFQGQLPRLALPTDFARPKTKQFEGRTQYFAISSTHSQYLTQAAKQAQASLFATVLAATYAFMHLLTNQEDLLLGTPVAGREHADLQNQVGFYVNTLALRQAVSPSMTFEQLLAKVKSLVINALERQNYPFDQLVEDLAIPLNESRSPLFDVLVTANLFDIDTTGATPGATTPPPQTPPTAPMPEVAQGTDQIDQPNANEQAQADAQQGVDPQITTAKFDLTIGFAPAPTGLTMSFNYSTALFEALTIDLMHQRFMRMLEQLHQQPNTPLQSLDLRLEWEKAQDDPGAEVDDDFDL